MYVLAELPIYPCGGGLLFSFGTSFTEKLAQTYPNFYVIIQGKVLTRKKKLPAGSKLL